MMPLFDISYLVQQQRQAAATHEVPLSTLAGGPLIRSREEQSTRARDQYYQLQRDPPRKPWYYRKKMLPFTILMTVVSAIISCIVVTVKLTRKTILMMKTHPRETITQSVTAMTTYSIVPTNISNNMPNLTTISSNASLSLTTLMSRLPSMATMTTTTSASPSPSPILSLSNIASVFVDGENSKDSWDILIWQDGEGFLSCLYGESDLNGQGRIKNLLKNAPKAKRRTPMAVVADDARVAHLFYLDENDVISHVFMQSEGSWKRGGMSTGSKNIPAHKKSTLSAAFHRGEHDTNIVILSYQDPDGNLQLAMSEDPKKDEDWYTVDFNSFTGSRRIGDWGGVGHALAGDWQNKRQDPDGSFSGLLMAVEESEEVTPWECSMDIHASSKKQVECHWLDKTFLDSNGKGLSLFSRTNQFAWSRTGHGENKGPAQTLPYEFALLHIDSEGSIQENRVGIDIPRIVGSGFNVDMRFDSFATNGNKTVYAKSGSDVVVFRLEADGWQWKVDGIVNTTISETGS